MVEIEKNGDQNQQAETANTPAHIRMLIEGFPGEPIKEGSSDYIPGQGYVSRPALIEFRGQNHQILRGEEGEPYTITKQQVMEAIPFIEKRLAEDFDIEIAGRLTTLVDMFEIDDAE